MAKTRNKIKTRHKTRHRKSRKHNYNKRRISRRRVMRGGDKRYTVILYRVESGEPMIELFNGVVKENDIIEYEQLNVEDSQKNFIKDLYETGNINVSHLKNATTLTPEQSNVRLKVSKREKQ